MGRREQIVAAALRILGDRGPSAVTVRSVAQEAGIGPSTLRHYFPTQSALLLAVQGDSLSALLSDEQVADAAIDPAERLTSCLLQFLPVSQERIGDLALWAEMVGQAYGRTPGPVRATFVTLSEQTRASVERWLQVLRAEGRLVGDAPDLADRLLVLIDGLSLALLNPSSPITVSDARRWVREAAERATTGAVRTAPSEHTGVHGADDRPG